MPTGRIRITGTTTIIEARGPKRPAGWAMEVLTCSLPSFSPSTSSELLPKLLHKRHIDNPGVGMLLDPLLPLHHRVYHLLAVLRIFFRVFRRRTEHLRRELIIPEIFQAIRVLFRASISQRIAAAAMIAIRTASATRSRLFFPSIVCPAIFDLNIQQLAPPERDLNLSFLPVRFHGALPKN